jgi:hypothetical protein
MFKINKNEKTNVIYYCNNKTYQEQNQLREDDTTNNDEDAHKTLR